MFQDISIAELMDEQKKKDYVLIDVRSPSEYKEASIPGSINIPVFNDEERAEVGTIYKQNSSHAAKERGLEIFSAKLPAFIKEFSQVEGEKVVFCWRGGMRSKTAATVLDLMGIHTHRILGGVRAYRKWVVEKIEKMEFLPQAYVLNGFTGIGKTKILKWLEEEGYPVLDLEEMAGHRGSIFGQIGLKPNNQKAFDALLVEKALEFKDAPYVLFEAESKRIGKAVMPDFLVEKKENGMQIFIELPIEERVKHILEDYQPWEHQEECVEAFRIIKNRLHTPIGKEIEEALLKEDYSLGVSLLLEHYYDPRYDHTAKQFPEERRIKIQAENAEDAFKKIKEILKPAAVRSE